jgi:transglutaminase-like putative cysteine protease
VHFVSKYVEDKVAPSNPSVSEIITSKKGDCSEHALLFVTLARAAGIPARQVGGLMYMGDDVKAFGGHAWDEVALDGQWVPVDPTWDETTADATHITLERDDKGMGFLATLGRLRVQLKEVAPAPAAKPIK